MTVVGSAFERYEGINLEVPVHRISRRGYPSIHRFFDSSPISPSGRLIAITEFSFEDRLPGPGDQAVVLVLDLSTGGEVYRSETAAWDTQLGAQVQWGGDDQLFFNRMDAVAWRPYGVRVDLRTGSETPLDGSLYHVTRDGRYAVSPDLIKITIAQAGYGVHVPKEYVLPNRGAPDDDGVFVLDTRTGERHLVASLHQMAEVVAPGRLTIEAGSAYTFHTKWSPDGRRIMVILRWFPTGKSKSRNWLLTMDADGGNIRVAVPPEVWGDGHHPNWYPDSDGIVMNLPSVGGIQGALRRLIGKVGRRLPLKLLKTGVPLHFKHVRYDGTGLRSLSRAQGSGHPTIHPMGQHLLSDCYLDEPMAYGDGTVPLRLIDLASGRVSVPVRIGCRPSFLGGKKEWRIDPHPAWHESGRYLAFNGAADGVRAVFVADFDGMLV